MARERCASGFSGRAGATAGEHEDFEDFGRGLSENEVVREAFDHFVEILSETGCLRPLPNVR